MDRAEHAVTVDPLYTLWAQECGGPEGSPLLRQAGLERDPATLAAVAVPTLVVEAPEDPINPPPHATYLAGTIGGARLVRIDGMGHALPAAAVGPLADAILAHTAAADAGTGRPGSRPLPICGRLPGDPCAATGEVVTCAPATVGRRLRRCFVPSKGD